MEHARSSGLLRDRLPPPGRAEIAGVARLTAEQERWISLERGTMLPGFGGGSAAFSVKPADALFAFAFGDFGIVAPQSALGKTIASHHQRQPSTWR